MGFVTISLTRYEMPMNYQKLYLSACGISLISLIATDRGDDFSHSNMILIGWGHDGKK